MIEYLPLVLTGLGLTASIIYYANILNNANKTRELQLKAQELTAETRQVQIFMHYLDRIWDPDIQEVYEVVYPNFTNVDEFMEKYRDDLKFQRVFFRWAYYWENAGMFLKLGYLPIEFITTSPSIAINEINTRAQTWFTSFENQGELDETSLCGNISTMSW
jgi:hypothetical protein